MAKETLPFYVASTSNELQRGMSSVYHTNEHKMAKGAVLTPIHAKTRTFKPVLCGNLSFHPILYYAGLGNYNPSHLLHRHGSRGP